MGAANIFLSQCWNLRAFIVGISLLLPFYSVQALVPLEEEEMAGVTGEGLAFAFDDFRFQMAGTSFFEHVGAEPQGDTVFNRGDLRWIGTTISSGTARSSDDGGEGHQQAYAYHQWDNLHGASECSTVGNPLGCPIAVGGAQGYVEVNNPYVLRVREYEAVGWNGSAWVSDYKNPVVELVGATNSDPFRWAFWGEIDALEGSNPRRGPDYDEENDHTRLGKLQNQEIILGAPVSRLNPNAGDGAENIVGPVFQMYKNWSDDDYANDTLGMLYHHRLSGDYRFSVHQNGPGIIDDGGPNHGNAPWGTVPHFTDREGMYFMNVNTYLPLGQLHYQSMIVGGVEAGDPTGAPEGNFFLELTRIPDDPTVYEHFYALPSDSSDGYVTAEQRWNRSDQYYYTHGYARWGEKFPESEGGVSKTRYIGHDPDGPTRHLNTQGHCGSSMPGWGSWANGSNNGSSGPCNDGIQDRNIGDVVFGAVEEGQDQVLLEEGGMVFLSARDNTWSIKNNANANVNNDLKMVWVKESGLIRKRYELQVDARYNNTAYNPELQVSGINLGSSRAEGMLINHLKITSLGAAAP